MDGLELWFVAGTQEMYGAAAIGKIAGIELVVVDAETRPRDFARELRWSQAYYRLAEGF